MASTHSKHSISKNSSITNLNKYNTQEIQSWYKALEIKSDIIPLGWNTRYEIVQITNKCKSYVFSCLQSGIKNNLIEVKNFRKNCIINGINVLNRPLPHYHIKNIKTNWCLFLNPLEEQTPKAWNTKKEIIKITKRGNNSIDKALDYGIKNNLIDFKKFQKKAINGMSGKYCLRPIVHYHLKSNNQNWNLLFTLKNEIIPKGWCTSKEISEKIKKNKNITCEALYIAFKQNLIKIKRFRVNRLDGLHSIIHYYSIKYKNWNFLLKDYI